MLTDYESRVRVRGTLPTASFARKNFSIKAMQQGPCVKSYQPKPGANSVCIEYGPPVSKNTSFGYIFYEIPDFEYSIISDYVGKSYDYTKVTKIPLYNRSKLCNKLRSTLSHADFKKTHCYKPIGYRTYHNVVTANHNAKKEGTMLPVDHLSSSRKSSDAGFSGPHNSYLYAYELNKPNADMKYSAHVDLQYIDPIGALMRDPSLVRESVDLMVVYRAIARGLSKMNDFTTKTQTDLIANILQAKQMMSILSFVKFFPKNPLTGFASAFLAYQFAIKPSIEDYKTMVSMSKKIRKAMKEWNDKVGKVQYFHYTYLDNEIETSSRKIYTYCNGTIVTNKKNLGKATVAIIGNRATVSESIIKMSQLGINKPLETLWEIIPFSFIIDWFTDISGFIAQVSAPECPLKFTVQDACYSMLNEVKTTSTTSNRRGLVFSGDIFCSAKSYYRSNLNVDILNDVTLMNQIGAWAPSSRFGPHQAILLGALAVVLNPSLRR
jgi:hypothetical protein